MARETGPAENPVTSNDIVAFAGRLADWCNSLSPAEQSLAQVLLQYTRDLRPEDVYRNQIVADLAEATRGVITSIKERWSTEAQAEAWVEVGPIWQKALPTSPTEREQWEIVQWIYTRSEKWPPQL